MDFTQYYYILLWSKQRFKQHKVFLFKKVTQHLINSTNLFDWTTIASICSLNFKPQSIQIQKSFAEKTCSIKQLVLLPVSFTANE